MLLLCPIRSELGANTMQFFAAWILSFQVKTAAHQEADARINYNLKVAVVKIRQTFTQLIQEVSLLET